MVDGWPGWSHVRGLDWAKRHLFVLECETNGWENNVGVNKKIDRAIWMPKHQCPTALRVATRPCTLDFVTVGVKAE